MRKGDISRITETTSKYYLGMIGKQLFEPNPIYKYLPKLDDVKITWFDRLRWMVREKTKRVRVAIAEWIGGSDLHENCDW